MIGRHRGQLRALIQIGHFHRQPPASSLIGFGEGRERRRMNFTADRGSGSRLIGTEPRGTVAWSSVSSSV